MTYINPRTAKLLRQLGIPIPRDRAATLRTVLDGAPEGTAAYAVRELATQWVGEAVWPGQLLASPRDASEYVLVRYRAREHEVFSCLWLDNRHRIIEFEEMFRGTIDCASVHPREVVKRALEVNAAAVILVHNHPSGDADPSPSDVQITDRLRAALDLVEVRVLDHLVVGEMVESLADMGLLS